MKKILVVVDMQNDFITGPLGTPEAVSIVDKVVEKINGGAGWDYVYYTEDTHFDNYLSTQEGIKLPIKHCIFGTEGRQLNEKVSKALDEAWSLTELVIKGSFGTEILPGRIRGNLITQGLLDSDIELTLVGVCTDICVISNALLLKAHYPEMKIVVDASCCAGSTPEKHRMALEVMKSCQVDVVNDEEDNNWIIITSLLEKMANPGYILSAEDTRKALAIAEEHPESTPAYLKTMHREPYNTLLESDLTVTVEERDK